METTAVLPAILASTKALCPGVPIWLGPAVIAPSATPYSQGFAANPNLQRVCMSRSDPRHAALFGAAYLLAVLAHSAQSCAVLCPAFDTGPSGLVGPDGHRLPISFVHAAVAEAAGRDLLRVDAGTGIVGFGWQNGDRRTVLICNTGTLPCDLALPDLTKAERLATADLGWVRAPAEGRVTLHPYATWRFHLKA